jgi:hypothetical protein
MLLSPRKGSILTSWQRRARGPRILRVAIYLILTVASGYAAFILLQFSTPQQQPQGDDVTPNMLLLTSQHGIIASVNIDYYNSYQSTQEGMSFGSPSGSLPTGSREIQIQFSGGKPASSLQYSVLLGKNGAEANPVGQQNEQVFSGTPGGTSDCVSSQTVGIVQVLYGVLRLDAQGRGTVTTVGRLMDQHAFLKEGASYVVGVIDVNSPITDLGSSGPGNTCIFPDWPYLGGVLWYSPTSLSGEVSIGQVGGNYDVTSSNPSLTDLSSLSWQINGSTSINYTMTDDTIGRQQLIESFGAGVVAALAAALAVETAKNAIGKAAESNEEDLTLGNAVREALRDTRNYDKHPVLSRVVVATTILAAIRKKNPRN